MNTTTKRRSAEIPVITVYCRDQIHADIPQVVVARFGKYPPGFVDDIGGWHLLSDFHEHKFDDTPHQRRRRFADEVIRVDGEVRYNIRCPKCDRRSRGRPSAERAKATNARPRWQVLQSICEALVARGESSISLGELAATVSRSAGRKI